MESCTIDKWREFEESSIMPVSPLKRTSSTVKKFYLYLIQSIGEIMNEKLPDQCLNVRWIDVSYLGNLSTE